MNGSKQKAPPKTHAIVAAEKLVKRIDSVARMLKDKEGKEVLNASSLLGLRHELVESIGKHDIMGIAAIATRVDHEIERIGTAIKEKAMKLLSLLTPEIHVDEKDAAPTTKEEKED